MRPCDLCSVYGAEKECQGEIAGWYLPLEKTQWVSYCSGSAHLLGMGTYSFGPEKPKE